MSLTVCDEKGTCTSVIFPKGSLNKKQVYETSVELSKKFNTIFKVRLEIEEAGEGETWHCREVKNLKTKAIAYCVFIVKFSCFSHSMAIASSFQFCLKLHNFNLQE